MSNWQVDNEQNLADPAERVGLGTIGDQHMIPGSLSGRSFNQIITPADPRLTQGGPAGTSWNYAAGNNSFDFLGYQLLSSNPGAYLNINFSGSSIAIIGQTGPTGGRADILIDGQPVNGKVNTYTNLNISYFSSPGKALNTTDQIISVSNPGDFIQTGGTLIIDSEEITYTGVSGATFIGCVRGANNTTAASHIAGTTVYQGNTAIELYEPYQQDRVILWSKSGLRNTQHTLSLVIRADHNPSSIGYQVYLNGFIQGGVVGAQSINTFTNYLQVGPFATDANGVSTLDIALTPPSTDSQLLSFLGCYPISGCASAYVMPKGNDTIRIATNVASAASVTVLLSSVYLGRSI